MRIWRAVETGRPRTEAYIVYLFLMLRGLNGGCKDQHARSLLQESITLRLWLEHLGLEFDHTGKTDLSEAVCCVNGNRGNLMLPT